MHACIFLLSRSVCQGKVHDIITVSTDEICATIKDIFGDTRALMEPLGALSVAGLKKYCRQSHSINPKIQNQTLVAVLAAANMDFDRLRFVAERYTHISKLEKQGC